MSLRQRLLSQSTVIFGSRLFGAGLTFLVQVAIARFLGADALGEYLLVMAAVNIIAVVMPLGFETTGTYFAAEYRARGEGRLLRGFMLRGYGHVAITGLLLLLVGRPILSLFGPSGEILAAHWLPISILCIATALVFVSGALLVGLKRPFAGYFAETLFRPMLAIGGFAIALTELGDARISTLIWVLAIGYAVVALGQLVIVVRSTREIPLEAEVRSEEWKRWWNFALPWIALVVAGEFFYDIDLLLLSGHLGREELAIFGVCTRVFSLVSFGVGAIYAVTMPDMFESEALADRAGFHRKIGEANLIASGMSVALLAAVVVGAPVAFLLFGPAFQAGVVPLVILCIGLVIRSVFGPASVVLSVHNRPYASLPAVVASLAMLVLANLVLVPNFGLTGAALAALAGMSTWSGVLWFTALKVAGVDVSLRARLTRPAAPIAKAAD